MNEVEHVFFQICGVGKVDEPMLDSYSTDKDNPI
jgi:hypothetical protein